MVAQKPICEGVGLLSRNLVKYLGLGKDHEHK